MIENNLPKLVRDRIPLIIEETNSTCTVSYVNDLKEHEKWLKSKILEETNEFIEDSSYSEAADMLEVIKALCYINSLDWDVVLRTAELKEETHGGFYNGVILETVDYEIKNA